jgi:hypothetical protein
MYPTPFLGVFSDIFFNYFSNAGNVVLDSGVIVFFCFNMQRRFNDYLMRIIVFPDDKHRQYGRPRPLGKDYRPGGRGRLPAEEVYEYPGGAEILVQGNE